MFLKKHIIPLFSQCVSVFVVTFKIAIIYSGCCHAPLVFIPNKETGVWGGSPICLCVKVLR